ncbi:hypothetical protein [Acetobacter senegalensis]|uniref:hypothetical protein n=1 Tax=Acetobacter senegalensis TaxID=446692 RepID=UPI00264B25B7|nr:hypothetical protein [Acetobacter senegalensis]MDN7350460.1 hypothetical protein [Acetobacter senegalensis]
MSKKEVKTEIEAALIQASATITAEYLRAHERNERASVAGGTENRSSDLSKIYEKQALENLYKTHLDVLRAAYLSDHK